jgi:hypothetical protein
MSEPSEILSVAPAIEILFGRLNTLNTEATELCQRHFTFVMAENKTRDWAQKSVLFAQPRMRDNNMTVYWYEIRWYGSKAAKTRRMTKKLIKKPKANYGYNMAALLKLAQPWEEARVQEVELGVVGIRREVAFISKAIAQLNYATKGVTKR